MHTECVQMGVGDGAGGGLKGDFRGKSEEPRGADYSKRQGECYEQ